MILAPIAAIITSMGHRYLPSRGSQVKIPAEDMERYDANIFAQPVDLPETFNYLIGLNVETRQVYPHPGVAGTAGTASVPDANPGNVPVPGANPGNVPVPGAKAAVPAANTSVPAANTSVPAANGRDVHHPGYLVYRGTTREGRRVVVIWRETAGWTEEDYKRDRDFVVAQKLTEGADEIFINGDSLIPGARALESVFKARLFSGVEG